MQTFLMYVVITVLLSPLLVFYGLPFVIAAWLFHRWTPLWLGARSRFMGACAIAALGIAPAYDDFLMPKAIYLRLMDGDDVALGACALAFALTWLIVMAQVRLIRHRHSRQYA
jgi:hypothetical protein